MLQLGKIWPDKLNDYGYLKYVNPAGFLTKALVAGMVRPK